MAKNTAAVAEKKVTAEMPGEATTESIGGILGECRSRIDELLVQLDVARLDTREEVDRRLAVAQNAYMAARSTLSDARTDAASTMESLRKNLEQILHDIGRAYAEVDAAVKRGASVAR